MSVYDDLKLGNKTAIRDKTAADSITPGDVADRLDALVDAVSNVDVFSEVVFDTANGAQATANNAYALASDAEDLGLNAGIHAAQALVAANAAQTTANTANTAAAAAQSTADAANAAAAAAAATANNAATAAASANTAAASANNTANAALLAAQRPFNAFTLAFNYPVCIFIDYYEVAVAISAILLKDAASIAYSFDGNTYTNISVPLNADFNIPGVSWVWWKVTYPANKTNVSAYFKLR